jgi:PREDICTED: similar to protein T23F11.1 [imported] - caenorhabditis elegans
MTRCLAPDGQTGGLGCDNMTILLICFLHGKSYEHLSAKCSMAPIKRGRLNSTDSSDSSLLSTSCSSSTPETQELDEVTPRGTAHEKDLEENASQIVVNDLGNKEESENSNISFV